jgi:hypothetical protein
MEAILFLILYGAYMLLWVVVFICAFANLKEAFKKPADK